MDTEKQKKVLIRIAYWAAIAALIYCGLKYLLPTFTPFLLAFFIVWLLRGGSRWAAKKLHLPHKYVHLAFLLVFYLILFGLVSLAGIQVFGLIRDAVPKLPSLYRNELVPALKVLAEIVEQSLARFDPDLVYAMESALTVLSSNIESSILAFSRTVMAWASNVMLGVPSLIIQLVLMITSSFFLASDYDRVMGFLYRCLPQKAGSRVHEVWHKLAGSLWIYIRSYALLLCITFSELAIGLTLLKVPYSGVVAAAIAIFDLMPILGTGGVLIPWTVIAAIVGNYGMALGIGALYIIITIVRNSVEPKLVGKQIGLHPLATLIALFVGSQLFGIVGLFGFPVALSVIVQLRRSRKEQEKMAQVSQEME